MEDAIIITTKGILSIFISMSTLAIGVWILRRINK